ncbi:penicillin-binding protein 2 [Clostridium sp. 19966]|uniref:peptidoglycan D,D-transpeptidase FtsI family protein n=1 Tax=Clostridium sp. 19966 TaxID=2768166 RepID=UPI0028DE269E|nr:penicillin-binding transpeptidase domain-containing protein [Clostridium sp. 19966]MDT8716095.1 penicillin-binding protein 2 [Clostridium sp. 19966]
MDDISKNIKKVLIIFFLLFCLLISYFSYFIVVKGPSVAKNTNNKRLWAKRNEVLRGTIYDRNMTALTKSEKINTLTQKREYTGGALFAHALGYVNQKYGITGLESTYDDDLMADNELSFWDLWKNKGVDKEKVGHSIETTLDSNVQKAAYDLLGDRKGAVVALNPKTGEILAMVSKPSFDPNNLDTIWSSINSDKNRPLLNRAVSGLYPPGSSFKVVTTTSALQNLPGIDNEIFHDTGKLYFNSKYSLSNFGGEVNGDINLKQALQVSSNFVFGTIAGRLGNSKLKATAESYGFNKSIKGNGIIVDNSRFPTIPSTEPGNIAQSGIGQSSILATPMQMALVASTVANGGVMMKPNLVKKVMTYDGKTISTVQAEILNTVTTKDIAAEIGSYMRGVVTSGTGRAASVAGVEVAGKTGTADHSDDGNSTPHAWFIGFAPYSNPTVAVAVIVEDGGQGGIAAAQITSGVIKTALGK